MRTPTELRDSTSPHVEGLIEAVARHLWGEPNEQLSKPGELRFGTNGSKSVDLDKLQFYDHEQQVGGSTLQLIKLEIGCADRKAQCAWLLQNGFISGAEGKRTSGGEVKGDVSDWLDAGHDADELLCMVEAAAPAPEPEKEEKEERESQADLIVKFALGRHELLHDDQKAVYARSHDSGMPSRRWPTMWRNTVSNRWVLSA